MTQHYDSKIPVDYRCKACNEPISRLNNVGLCVKCWPLQTPMCDICGYPKETGHTCCDEAMAEKLAHHILNRKNVKPVEGETEYTYCGELKVPICDLCGEPKTLLHRCGANSNQVGGTHYKTGGEEHWDRVWRLYGRGYFVGCITKYVERYHKKNGIEDLRKAKHFLEKLIELELSTCSCGAMFNGTSMGHLPGCPAAQTGSEEPGESYVNQG